MIKVALSAGHTLKTAGKRTPPIKELNNRVIHEHEFNRACLNKIMQGLGRCGIDYLDVTPSSNDKNEDLRGRVKRANDAKCDIFVAVHYNAFDSKFDEPAKEDPDGIEIFYCPGSAKGKKLAKSIYKYMQQGTKQKHRGVKSANYYVLRKTHMPAVLSENGFMDDKREAMLMLDEKFILECAEEHVKGICEYFNIAYVAPKFNVHTVMHPFDIERKNAAQWAKEKGISDGTRPSDAVTRAEAWIMLKRMAEKNCM